VLKGLTAVLVLHPICAALALIVFIITLFIRSHAMSIFALVAAVFLAIVGTIVLAIDIALVVFARAKVPDLTNGTNLVVPSFAQQSYITHALYPLRCVYRRLRQWSMDGRWRRHLLLAWRHCPKCTGMSLL
jgi:hypothetical protein